MSAVVENHVRWRRGVELDRRMSITLETATVGSLDEVAEAVASWQQEGGSVQLHPGDLGWNWSFGAEHLAAAVSGFIAAYWSVRLVLQFTCLDRSDAPKGPWFSVAEGALVSLFVFLSATYAGALLANLSR